MKLLHKLVRMVHPDLFHTDETCRQVNEKSFQALMQFLDILERPFGLFGQSSFHLRFFYREADDTIKEVAVCFEVRPGLLYAEERKAYAAACIRKLLSAMGVTDENDATGDTEASVGSERLATALSRFLREHIVMARQRQVDYEVQREAFKALEQRVKGELAADFYVSMFVDRDAAQVSMQRILENQQAFNACDLDGLKLVLGSEYKLRDDGTLSIPHDFSLEGALAFIRAQRTEALQDTQAHTLLSNQIKNLSDHLQHKLGLSWLGSSTECRDIEILQGLQCLQACCDALAQYDFHQMSMWIGKDFRIAAGGTLVISFQFQCAELLNFLDSNMSEARARMHKGRQLRESIEAKAKEFRKKTKASVRANIFISDEDYDDCLSRLLQAVGVFNTINVEGHYFSAGEEYNVREDGTIQIRHDFTVEEMAQILFQTAHDTHRLGSQPFLNY